MSDTLPTREEIAEIARHIYGEQDDVMHTADLAFADALLARLRPMWERMEQNQRTDDDHALCVEAKDYDMIQRELKQTADGCDALRADLRACAGALRHALESEDVSEWDTESLAALARPGVREALK